jgi:hypothetical protein
VEVVKEKEISFRDSNLSTQKQGCPDSLNCFFLRKKAWQTIVVEINEKLILQFKQKSLAEYMNNIYFPIQ